MSTLPDTSPTSLADAVFRRAASGQRESLDDFATRRTQEPPTIQALLQAALPDKAEYFEDWIQALAAPHVCINTLEDVKRLDAEDIPSLPVPPLVKGILREVMAREAARKQEQQLVLKNTAARKVAFFQKLRDRNMQPPGAGSKYFQDAKSYRLILTQQEIQAGVRIISHRIETWCKGERIILVGILKGAFMLMSDLCRTLTRPYSVYFVEASSYGDKRHQGSIQIAGELASSKFCDTTTKFPHKIVLVDELLDNGKTMQDMKQYFLTQLASTHTEKDVLTVCLFSKTRHRDLPEADITGIPNLPDLWLVGYGLDDRGTKRGWQELFAIPKVKIVETFEEEEVQKLLDTLDDNAMLTKPMIFSGFELTCDHKQRYRVNGVDVSAGRINPSLQNPEAKVTCKADIVRILAGTSTVKGKYEQEMHFAFIQERVALVPEDEIFSGNNQVYADMRCRLRKQIAVAADKFGVSGPGELTME
eukprot:CAMPEP_0170614662 /NCGR_PEP_ID=MMETSP0224-20130122/24924_1 /TAXON_ID=285029 /ORGANISM="Togula jolla, Strain CCCM 725" /LENGTH=475 /DNA_ID=CAMNT_0010940343 /DNA_START=6 /DNA_END=1433 /DNA_ORIENTATION=+